MDNVFSLISGTGDMSKRVYVDKPGIYLFAPSIKNLKYTVGGVSGPLVRLEKGEYVIMIRGPRGYPFTMSCRLLETRG